MKTDWLKDCYNTDEKTARKELIRSALPALKVLKSIVEGTIQNLEDQRLARVNFDKPSWPYEQADINGAIRNCKYILTLLDQEDILRE